MEYTLHASCAFNMASRINVFFLLYIIYLYIIENNFNGIFLRHGKMRVIIKTIEIKFIESSLKAEREQLKGNCVLIFSL